MTGSDATSPMEVVQSINCVTVMCVCVCASHRRLLVSETSPTTGRQNSPESTTHAGDPMAPRHVRAKSGSGSSILLWQKPSIYPLLASSLAQKCFDSVRWRCGAQQSGSPCEEYHNPSRWTIVLGHGRPKHYAHMTSVV